jgi:hypothetical protein
VLQIEKLAKGNKTDLVKVVTAWEIENDESASQADASRAPRHLPSDSQSDFASQHQPPLEAAGRGPIRDLQYMGSGNLQMPFNSRASHQQAPSDAASEDQESPDRPSNLEDKAEALSHGSANSLSMREEYLPR